MKDKTDTHRGVASLSGEEGRAIHAYTATRDSNASGDLSDVVRSLMRGAIET